ncbi:MAG: gluzincin family metallopeptidase [Candidatus Xenobia bacterium]
MVSAIRVNNRALPRAAAPPPTASSGTEFSYNAQDSTVFPTGTTTLPNVTVENGSVDTPAAQLSSPLAPSSDGKFVYKDGDPNEVAANSFAAVNKTVNAFGQALGQPVGWSFQGKLGVAYDAGQDFNAYYSRDTQNVNFFHGTDPKTNQVIFSGASGEVVSHETGHAILDGLRPAYFSSFTPDVAAFHESFGDMMAICMAFQDNATLDNVVSETGGDLSKDNAISRTGEQLGVAINDVEGSNVTGGGYVRDARNNFKWADPSTLPQDGGPTQLGSEAHSFSRLWTGAFYDILTAIQKQNMDSGMDAKTALQATGQTAIDLLARCIKNAPQGDFTYRDMANAWVDAENKSDGGKYSALMTRVFTDRGILGDQPAPPPAPPPQGNIDFPSDEPMQVKSNLFTSTDAGRVPLSDVTRTINVPLSGPQYGIFSGAKVQTLVDSDGSLEKDAEVTLRTQASVKKLIDAGRIKYTAPGQKITNQDLFDKNGQPYFGVVRWNNGQMTIERVKIAD